MKSQKKRQLVSGYGGPGGVTLFRKNRSLVVMGGLGGLPRFLRYSRAGGGWGVTRSYQPFHPPSYKQPYTFIGCPINFIGYPIKFIGVPIKAHNLCYKTLD